MFRKTALRITGALFLFVTLIRLKFSKLILF